MATDYGSTTTTPLLVVAAGKCVTINDGNLVMHERKPGTYYPTYLYMSKKGQEYDDQRWILHKVHRNGWKLQNQLSKRFMILDGSSYVRTFENAISSLTTVEFRPHGEKFEIFNRFLARPRSQGDGYGVIMVNEPTYWTLKQCEKQ